jgi:hypothetical protein
MTLCYMVMTIWTVGGWVRAMWSRPSRAAELRGRVRTRTPFLLGLSVWLALLFAVDILHEGG